MLWYADSYNFYRIYNCLSVSGYQETRVFINMKGGCRNTQRYKQHKQHSTKPCFSISAPMDIRLQRFFPLSAKKFLKFTKVCHSTRLKVRKYWWSMLFENSENIVSDKPMKHSRSLYLTPDHRKRMRVSITMYWTKNTSQILQGLSMFTCSYEIEGKNRN